MLPPGHGDPDELVGFGYLWARIKRRHWWCVAVPFFTLAGCCITMTVYTINAQFAKRDSPLTSTETKVQQFDAPMMMLCWSNATLNTVLAVGCYHCVSGSCTAAQGADGESMQGTIMTDAQIDELGVFQRKRERVCVQFGATTDPLKIGGENAAQTQIEIFALLHLPEDPSWTLVNNGSRIQSAVLYSVANPLKVSSRAPNLQPSSAFIAPCLADDPCALCRRAVDDAG